MATLEKIRRRSVLLIVVIAVALLAFIVGDALTNSRNIFGDHTTVAKIGNHKIDYTEYQAKREELNNQLEMRKRQDPGFMFDTQILPQVAIEQLISEALLDDAVKAAGIQASGDQLRFYMLDNPVSQNLPALIQQMRTQGMDVQTPQQAYEIIFNPKRYGLTESQAAPFKNAWLAIENETKQLVKRNTYQRILVASIQANDLDTKALHNDIVEVADIRYAYKPYGNLDEKKYPVSDAELKAAYDKEKNRFKIDEETKSISFISVNVPPSAADRKASQALSARLMKELGDSAAGLSKELKKSGIQPARKSLRASDLNSGAIKDFVLAAAPGESKLIRENISGFVAVKMGKRTSAVDSIQINMVQVAGNTLPSKVLSALNSGLSIDSISTRFNKDSVASVKERWFQLYTAEGPTNALEQSQIDSLTNAGGKYITLISEGGGAVLAQLVKKNAPVEIYEFEEYDYQLKPSTETVSAARNKLEKFLAQNPDAASFNKNAAKAGYSVNKYDVNQSTPAIPVMEGAQAFFPDSRQVMRWVMIDGDKGEVSHLYESKDALRPMLYAVAIDDVMEDYLPVSNRNVKTYLTDKVRKDKAGDALVKEYKSKGKTIDQIAAAMQMPVMEGKQKMARSMSALSDPAIVGTVMGSKKGSGVKVLKGKNGVAAVEVRNVSKENQPYDKEAYSRQYFQYMQPDVNKMLRGTKKFKNNAYKFEAGD